MHYTNKVYINLLPIRSGGGLQNALSFLSMVSQDELLKDSIILTYKKSQISEFARSVGLSTVEIPSKRFARFIYELLYSKYDIEQGSTIFTLFGPPPLRKHKCKLINGCAYSNLLYPEIKFWGFLPLHKRIIKWITDFYRKQSYRRTDVVIFETEVLLSRAKRDNVFRKKDLRVVEMAPSSLVKKSNVEKIVCQGYEKKLNRNHIRLLYLAGPHENKRHHLWAEIISELKSIGVDVTLVVTLPEGRFFNDLEKQFNKQNVEDHLVNFGVIQAKDVASLISVVDGLVNTALLESFSNNFVEAWEMDKPLVVTKADWSEGACGDAALFIQPLDKIQSARLIKQLFLDDVSIANVTKNGNDKLSTLPSRLERFASYRDIIVGENK